MKYLRNITGAVQRSVQAIPWKNSVITPGSIVVLLLWLASLLIFVPDETERPVVTGGWGIMVPYTLFIYNYLLHKTIPRSLAKGGAFGRYMLRALLMVFLSFIPVFALTVLLTGGDEGALNVVLFLSMLNLITTAPIAWWIYRRRMSGEEEISMLKQELGQTSANFDFLRSQINPHFLFNALNTIYGTAIQENAERTGEGIEKLSDMMRYMLEDNMQEKIPLSREIEYLKNYISLQKLRTDATDQVQIQADIQEEAGNMEIAPMLLIPFVENAFKHGISFRERSIISVTLEIRENTLYFDVYNSKHRKQENDPEKNESGIGLENVRQRLQLQYPGTHELMIRETAKEFFVHLTITPDR